MAETTREMVVRLTMDAGGFKKTANEINTQIRNIDREIKSMGDDKSGKKSKLEEKLGLQKTAVDNLKKAVDQAKTKLAEATTEKDKLLAAKQLSGLETSLETAENKAKSLADELRSINLMEFSSLATKFGGVMKRMGRSLSLYVGAPLAALGFTSMNVFKEYEMAATILETKLDGTAEQVADDAERLSAAALEMSETIPVSYTEIMAIMTSLAAAGVPTDKIEGMTLALAQMAAVTGMSAEEVGTSMVLFMNAMNEPFENIDQLGAALVELADKSIATETDIFSMATRMAATGGLAGLSAVDVFSLAAAFSSMGVNAEAGGTAASKLMKQMQLATETGTVAMEAFSKANMTAGMSVREIQLAADDGKWLTGLAGEMEMTKEETKGMIDSMVSLQQYADVMETTIAGFSAMWEQSPADAMLNFFQGLSDLGSSGNEQSVLNILDQMGMTEVRLSNLVALGARNPDMFKDLLDVGDTGFAENLALVEKSDKIFDTASGQLDVFSNKMKNAQADLGENVTSALTPVIETVGNLVNEFSKLDEATQDRWVKIGGALVVLGPVASGIGGVATAVGKIAGWAGKVKAGEVDNVTKLMGALAGPVGGWLLVAGGIIGVVAAINSIKTPTEQIIDGLKNIQIGLDEQAYAETTAALAEVKAQADALSGKTGEHNKNLSTAVKAGYGTTDMYGTALGYEARLTQSQMAEIAGKYAEDIDKLNGLIGAETDAARQKALADQRDRLQAQWDSEATAAKAGYMAQVSALVAGMMQSQPEAKAVLEQAAKDYDLLAELERVSTQVMNEDDNAVIDALWAGLFAQDVRSKYFNGQSLDSLVPSTAVQLLRETLMNSLKTSLETAGSEDSFAYTLLQTILSDPLTSGMYDATLTTGALDGLVELLDFAAAAEKAGTDFGTALTPGLADAITGALPDSLAALQILGEQLAAEAAAQAAAVSAAWNEGLIFNTPNPGGGTPGGGTVGSTTNNNVTINTSSPTAGTGIYGIQRGLTDALQRVNRGYGKA